jgi:hypothetical protein
MDPNTDPNTSLLGLSSDSRHEFILIKGPGQGHNITCACDEIRGFRQKYHLGACLGSIRDNSRNTFQILVQNRSGTELTLRNMRNALYNYTPS